MLQKKTSSRDIGRKVSPPQPVFMSDEEKMDYLFKLRNNRPTRPAGSRPLPAKSRTHPLPNSDSPPTLLESALSPPPLESEPLTTLSDANGPPRCESAFSSGQLPSTPAIPDLSTGARTTRGRPLAKDPGQVSYSLGGHTASSVRVEPHARSSSNNYQESGAKWVERQEARSLREALQAMDQLDQKIHAAAQEEAATLVWQHRNPDAARREKTSEYANPDVDSHGRHRFTAHLQKGAYSRSQLPMHSPPKRATPTSPTLHSSSPDSDSFAMANNIDLPLSTSTLNPTNKQKRQDGQPHDDPDASAIGVNANDAVMKFNRRKSSGQRKISNGSSKSGFPNSGDQIYEDSAGPMPLNKNAVTTTATALRLTNRNPQVRGSRPLPGQPMGSGVETAKPIDRFEIQRNPPSQSRSAGYTQNTPSVDVVPKVQTSPHKDGLEIRGEDIRAATSMRLKDRSQNLPCPTAVSDHLKRPIVSFEIGWKPGNLSSDDSVKTERPNPKAAPTIPAMTVSAPIVPSINVINVEAPSGLSSNVPKDKSIPAISIPDDEPPPSRPLPQPSKATSERLPSSRSSSRLPWLSPLSRAGVPTAKCANCALPISGRVVTASGSGPSSSSLKARFHPECFTCYHCSTALECVAFYPEPEDRRLKRLEARGSLSNHHGDGGVLPESELRFYCHLDFHEFFSPRCRSCKTPIEGEVIVAAGGEWHVGHFFCSECGDPFDSNTPFVEKDNYAYCVSCHTRRTSARCRACKKQILEEMTVQALGGQWHAECFNCFECGGGFGAEGRFFVRDVRVEGTDKEKRRGIATKMEEKAVCQACEERRLKA